MRHFFEEEKGDHYNPVRLHNFWSKNHVKYESNENKNKTLLLQEYVNKIIPYLNDIIGGIKKFNTWKIQLARAIKFICSKDNDEKCVIYSKSDNIEVMINDKAGRFIKKLQSLLSRYQIALETSMKRSEFVYDRFKLG